MVDPDLNDQSIKRTFTNWLFGQESNTVALYLILLAMGYGGWWGITVGIPAHLMQIQKGYETVAEKNREVHKDIADRTHQDIQNLSNVFEKAIERQEKAFQAGFEAAGHKKGVGSSNE